MVLQASCVAIGGRAVLILGPSGSGKSSLALALIDRGAVLVGDDGVILAARAGLLFASPPPHTAGLLEVRNVGLIAHASAAEVPVALALELDPQAPRFIDAAGKLTLLAIDLPQVRLWPDSPVLALRAEAALSKYGIT
jgi:serine kinase of HPr protein (carbohydrate metabolism regulator)